MTSSSILILGSRGMVGSAITEASGDRAITAAQPPVESGVIGFDALSDDVSELIGRMQPTIPKAVVIAFGISGTHTCASDPVRSRYLNVDRVLSVAKGVVAAGSIPVILSSDAVFDGTPVIWSETDTPRPICEYGRQKLASEFAVAVLGVPYLIVRLSRVIADHARQRDLLFQWCGQMRRGETIMLAADQMFTPIAAADVGRIVVGLVDAGARGLIHVAGPEQVSTPALFDWLHDACVQRGATLKYKTQPCRVADLPGSDPRPPCTMLSIQRLMDIINPRFTTLKACVSDVAATVFAPLARDKMLMG